MKSKLEIRTFKHIAIIQTAFLGDVVLALPTVSKIKELSPDAILTFVTTPQASSIVKCATDINNVIVFDKRNKHKGFKWSYYE